MPTPLPGHTLVTTLADKDLLVRSKQGRWQATPNAQVQGQDWLVYEDQSCVPVFEGKIGNRVCLFDATDTHVAWYPLKLCPPVWFDTLGVSTLSTVAQFKERTQELSTLFAGTGQRVRITFFSHTPSRNVAQDYIKVEVTGTTLKGLVEDPIARSFGKRDAICTFDTQLKGAKLGEISFSLSAPPCSAHQLVQKLNTYEHTTQR